MSTYRYVRLDPTGNITCLVLDPVPGELKPEVTRRLMAECEQTAYLAEPSRPGARARIQLMGGEFCGNAAMASAAWLAAQDGLRPGGSVRVPLEVSGADGVLDCLVEAGEEEYRGTVDMPRVLEIFPVQSELLFSFQKPNALPERDGIRLTAVRMEGILHIVAESRQRLPDEAAEAALRKAAAYFGDEALGLLQWNEADGVMRPLVFVRGSGTMVWETGCGSGSAAVGALRAYRRGSGTTVTRVSQPGGVIKVSAEATEGRSCSVRISGRVRLGPVKTLTLP